MKKSLESVFSKISSPDIIIPKHTLGQVFLTDQNVIKKIILSSHLQDTDTVLEIGPGSGTLTRALARHVKEVIAIETDRRFCEQLNEEFKNKNVTVFHADILKFNMATLPHNLIVVSNLPYYISSPILGKLIAHRMHFQSLFITVQWEFGKRLVAKPNTKDYSAFSCFIQYYTMPQILFKIKRSSFRPQPKVDSCFIHLSVHPRPLFDVTDEKLLFDIIHRAFGQRRKTVVNTLSSLLKKDRLTKLLGLLGLNPHARAENLTLKDFLEITDAIKKELTP